ncbi:hypothetical protein [Pedobacter sp. GR22-6]|uniref:hypothetical protein n=1 Tax=Pedobacter sp. GR22-6 TaxID=3127957 RepID=UPI00307DF367
MSGQVNRAIVLCENWQDKMIMLEEVFGKGIEKDSARQQYDFLQRGINRISKGASPDEKLVLDMVRKTVTKLEKQLFPNPFLRALHKFKSAVFDKPLQAVRLEKLKTENIASLKETLGGLGLKSDKINLERLLDYEGAKAAVELTSPWGTNNYKVKVNFEMEPSGRYQTQSFTGTLKDALNPANTRSFTFDVELGINAREAANLLQGRAVLKYFPVEDNKMASKWLQLDFQHLTSEGKPQLKESPADHEFNLKQQVSAIAEALNKPELVSLRALNGLEEGNQISLKQVNGPTYYFAADPLNKQIMMLNDKRKPITLHQLKKQADIALKPQQGKSQLSSKQMDKKKQQDQSRGIV